MDKNNFYLVVFLVGIFGLDGLNGENSIASAIVLVGCLFAVVAWELLDRLYPKQEKPVIEETSKFEQSDLFKKK